MNHLVFDQLQEKVSIPMISIVEEAAKKAQQLGFDRLGLIGTKFTMEHTFSKNPL
ncbi:aspartate/glutamate racemase family protein [Salinibacillus xinjiangensis]|uniref:Uncharacterized protein n=1 Tax=Salinibacillus xinjiangensis TaxID=1229268 RepID=A0A6G1XA97_9BACI|nr:aspartate/glutamate racemase family protein [Salinibacillus xinjiangensis]MRG87800.1 hypothetical protein [Salinibacillus xinjiangensis]